MWTASAPLSFDQRELQRILQELRSGSSRYVLLPPAVSVVAMEDPVVTCAYCRSPRTSATEQCPGCGARQTVPTVTPAARARAFSDKLKAIVDYERRVFEKSK